MPNSSNYAACATNGRQLKRLASRSGLKRKMTMAVAVIQANITAIDAQAGHQSICPAGQNRATPMMTIPMVSRIA